MPRLLRLTGKQFVDILKRLGFEVVTIRGSHFQMRRVMGNIRQNITIPVHGNQPLALGTLKSIYRHKSQSLSVKMLRKIFFTQSEAMGKAVSA